MRLVTNYVPSHAVPADPAVLPDHDRMVYCVRMLGDKRALAQLYLDVGLMHLEGTAGALLSSSHSHSPLASIRIPERVAVSGGGAAAWRRDRDAARRLFEHARALAPDLEVPLLLPETEDTATGDEIKFEMPGVDVEMEVVPSPRRRKINDTAQDEGAEWYLYIPGLVGAGTALLVVGIVSAIGFSSWRRNQN
jgi:hypothetical protein